MQLVCLFFIAFHSPISFHFFRQEVDVGQFMSSLKMLSSKFAKLSFCSCHFISPFFSTWREKERRKMRAEKSIEQESTKSSPVPCALHVEEFSQTYTILLPKWNFSLISLDLRNQTIHYIKTLRYYGMYIGTHFTT